MMTVGSGMNLLAQYERLNRPMLFAKMLLDSSRWMMAKHLTGYSLTWRAKGMKRNNLLFQLAVLGRGTGEIGYGLLPTPNAEDHRDRGHYWDKCNQRRLTIGKQIGFSTLFKGRPDPIITEIIMGYPENWTKIE